jgi:tRNA G26 N,N-dimethylase Trm1
VCDGPLVMGGPIWNKKIHDAGFVKRLLEVARVSSNKETEESKREVNLGTSERI